MYLFEIHRETYFRSSVMYLFHIHITQFKCKIMFKILHLENEEYKNTYFTAIISTVISGKKHALALVQNL